jgi:hypothetical protein
MGRKYESHRRTFVQTIGSCNSPSTRLKRALFILFPRIYEVEEEHFPKEKMRAKSKGGKS